MLVDIEPAELGFRRPFKNEVSQVLHLRNPHSEPVAFKVKTTAPKQYCVRPNSGRIEPGRGVEVQVLLQAMKEDPAPDAKCRDKFLVQSVAVSADQEFANVSSIWQNVEKTAKSSIQERKIRVMWLAPQDTEDSQEQTNGVSDVPAEDPPAYTSPVGGAYNTPDAKLPVASDTKPIPPPDFEKSPGEQTPSVSRKLPSSSPPSDVKSTVSNLIPTSTEELKDQLNQARAQISKLQEQVNQGLRQRKVGGGAEKSQSSTTPALQQQLSQPTEAGVPLQIVAALCLLSFLLAYFFF